MGEWNIRLTSEKCQVYLANPQQYTQYEMTNYSCFRN